jgi:phenylpropionate dioxygenase-like ring-hydroxylating dioxygenase large terminal subunit
MDMRESTAASGDRIAALLARQPPDRPLIQEFYGDPAIFARDVERMLSRHWLCAGHVSQIPDPGDFFLYEMAAESVIIARGADGSLRALANVCRHRGSRVCREASGNAKLFICPYHAWTYNLDGSLRSARHMAETFAAAEHGLKALHLHVVEGLIFISFAEAPLGLTRVEEVLRQGCGPYGWASARVAHRETYPIQANWKLAVENYVECYHCAPAHPEYSKLHANEQPRARIAELNARMTERLAALGLAIPDRDHWALTASPGEEAVYLVRYAMLRSAVTGSADGQGVAPLMGDFTGYDGGATFIHVGPASFFLAYPDHGVIYRFMPKTVQHSEMEVIWLVRGDAREGVDYDRERLTWLWRVTSEADKRIIEDTQRGVNSRYYAPGPFAGMETSERRFIEWYLSEIR